MTATQRDVGVILVAAGRSTRMGGGEPKVWLDLDGAPLLARSLRTLARFDDLHRRLTTEIAAMTDDEWASAYAYDPDDDTLGEKILAGDLDCGVPIDCDPIVAACTIEGACVAGRCVTDRTGTADVCVGADPEQPGTPRADQCALP